MIEFIPKIDQHYICESRHYVFNGSPNPGNTSHYFRQKHDFAECLADLRRNSLEQLDIVLTRHDPLLTKLANCRISNKKLKQYGHERCAFVPWCPFCWEKLVYQPVVQSTISNTLNEFLDPFSHLTDYSLVCLSSGVELSHNDFATADENSAALELARKELFEHFNLQEFTDRIELVGFDYKLSNKSWVMYRNSLLLYPSTDVYVPPKRLTKKKHFISVLQDELSFVNLCKMSVLCSVYLTHNQTYSPTHTATFLRHALVTQSTGSGSP